MCLVEEQRREVIQVVLPHRELVRAFVDVPGMRHVLRGKVLMYAKADVEEAVFVAAGTHAVAGMAARIAIAP